MKEKERLKISIPDRITESTELESVFSPTDGGFYPASTASSGGEDEGSRVSDRQTVGNRLREMRVKTKRSLKQVADILKIRLVYIEAIEEGRYSDLPGMAYAVGFVRSYAEYLGLDHDQIVHDFRVETAGHDSPTELYFPEPETESQTPPIAIAVVCLMIVAILYAGWERWSTRWQNDAPVLDHNVEPPPAERDSSADEPVSVDDGIAVAREAYRSIREANMAKQDETADDEPVALAGEAKPGNEAMPAAGVRVTQADDNGNNSANGQEAVEKPLSNSGITLPENSHLYWNSSLGRFMPRASVESADVALQQETVSNRELNEVAETVGTALQATLPADNEAVFEDQDAILRTPAVYGDIGQDVRIVVEAVTDSWVQVRDADDSLILTRILYPGDRFRVPDQEGLTLMTGNAGGLQITVDRQSAPPIGPAGAVRRNVMLDANRLLAGTAVVRRVTGQTGFQPYPSSPSSEEEGVSSRIDDSPPLVTAP